MAQGKGLQRTFAMELSMNGVDPELDWVFVNADKAKTMFGNQGVQPSAIWIAALHPRALEYLEQAPILALAASFGAKSGTRQERAYIAMNLKPLFERGAKLKDVLAAFRVAYPLRAISATAIRPGVWSVLQAITRLVPPSTISQSIPAEKRKHLHWLGALETVWSTLERRAPRDDRNADFMIWLMTALSKEGADAGPAVPVDQVADFLICNRDDWNRRWTWDRLLKETAEWHEALANANIERINDGKYDTEVDYRDFPVEIEVDGFQFVALRSLRALIVEGKAMHHCVASYHPDIVSGRSRIYSIRLGDHRLATCEMRPWSDARAEVVQLKGPCNSKAPADVLKAADRAAMRITKALRGGVDL